MTNPTPHGQVPEALRLAQELDAVPETGADPQTIQEVAAELRRQHARIAELEARIKTMAEEHADELMVAHLDGMRAAQPAGAQQTGTAGLVGALEDAQRAINSMKVEAETAAQGDEQMMLEACETISNEGLQAGMAIRAALASHGQASAQAAPACKDSTPELHVGDSAFESWYSAYSPAHKGDKQRARDAYVAGMGDPLVTAAPTAVAGEPIGYCHEIKWRAHQSEQVQKITRKAHPEYGYTQALYTTQQPTQAQAGAVPLTDEQIEDLLICGNPTDEEKRLIRMGWDAAHGIKGGQHGTE